MRQSAKQCQPPLVITDHGEFIYIYVKVYNNKVMLKLSDKIVVKHISVKETLLKLDLEAKGQGHSKQQNNKHGHKNIQPPNKQSKALLGNCSAIEESKQVMNDLIKRTEKGKQRSRIIRLIITTTGKFLESRTKFNFLFLSTSDLGH